MEAVNRRVTAQVARAARYAGPLLIVLLSASCGFVIGVAAPWPGRRIVRPSHGRGPVSRAPGRRARVLPCSGLSQSPAWQSGWATGGVTLAGVPAPLRRCPPRPGGEAGEQVTSLWPWTSPMAAATVVSSRRMRS